MPTTTPTILDQINAENQINAEKTKVSERLARLDADRAKIATQLIDLETAERVLTRVRKTPPTLEDPHRRPLRKQRPPPPPEAVGGRQRQPQSSQRDANPAHRASASAFSPWLPARPDRNFTWRAQPIVRTMSAWRYSAISARDGSRSVRANCMRHRQQQSKHPRQPESKITKAPPQFL